MENKQYLKSNKYFKNKTTVFLMGWMLIKT